MYQSGFVKILAGVVIVVGFLGFVRYRRTHPAPIVNPSVTPTPSPTGEPTPTPTTPPPTPNPSPTPSPNPNPTPTPTPTPGPTPPPANDFTLGAGDYNYSLNFGGRDRTFKVHVPTSYNKNNPTPAVLVFHGGGQNADGIIAYSKMNDTSNANGFIAVYANGTGKFAAQTKILTWNAGICCGDAKANGVDDVGFVNAMLNDIGKKFNLNQKMIYATGYSNGGFLSYRLACELSDRIAAIGPIASSLGMSNCNPGRSVSIIHFHGTSDPCVPYAGGECGGCLGSVFGTCDPTQTMIKSFASKYGLSLSTTPSYNGACQSYKGGSVEVALCPIDGGGHVWPDGGTGPLPAKTIGTDTKALNANNVMWQFFKAHPKS